MILLSPLAGFTERWLPIGSLRERSTLVLLVNNYYKSMMMEGKVALVTDKGKLKIYTKKVRRLVKTEASTFPMFVLPTVYFHLLFCAILFIEFLLLYLHNHDNLFIM